MDCLNLTPKNSRQTSRNTTMNDHELNNRIKEKDYQIVKLNIDNPSFSFSKSEIQNAILHSNTIVSSYFGMLARKDLTLIVKIIYSKEFCEVISDGTGFQDILQTSFEILKSGNEAECENLQLLLRYIGPFLSKNETEFLFDMMCLQDCYPKILNNNFNHLFDLFLTLLVNNNPAPVSRFEQDNMKLIVSLAFQKLDLAEYDVEKILKIISQINSWNVNGISKLSADPTISYNIGQFYLTDIMVKDIENGIKWLKKAAQLNDTDAYYDLGSIYRKGDYGIKVNIFESIKWFKKAAQANDIDAIRALANIFHMGENGLIQVIIDDAEYWYHRGLELNDPVSIYNLGYLYETQPQLNKNILEVKALYEQAAGLGSDKAMILLALLYDSEKLGYKDELKYIEWLSKAAELGNPEAAELLQLLGVFNI